jgi:hypothetical protein
MTASNCSSSRASSVLVLIEPPGITDRSVC